MSEIREKQRNVECQKLKPIEKSLGEVPVPTKKARVRVSVPKQASKKKSKKKSNAKTLPHWPKSSGGGLAYKDTSECFSLPQNTGVHSEQWLVLWYLSLFFVMLSVFASYLKFPCLLLAFTEVSILSFGLKPVDIVNHCWTVGCQFALELISHAKERIVSKMIPEKKWLLFLTWKDIFETEKASFFYWLLIWQHIKSLHLECLKTKEPYIGPVYKLPSDWSYIFAVLAGFVLYFQIVESYIPIFLDP